MALSVPDLFSIGIGPSSSHAVGPVKAAKRFTDGLLDGGRPERVARLRAAELFGSPGATGPGHGSDKAINAARLCLQGTGEHKVSLDAAIETMRQTGADMNTKYKETSRGDLAVNVTEC